jgi:hypothetical protein
MLTLRRSLADRITDVLARQGGIQDRELIVKFAEHIMLLRGWERWWQDQIKDAYQLHQMDIMRLIVEARDAGDLDEAIWRCFLATHFGRPSADLGKDAQLHSAGRLLCAFGTEPVWTWERVSSDLPSLARWLEDQRTALAYLRFGNHRKHEIARPEQIYQVISSFVVWIQPLDRTPSQVFATNGSIAPEIEFDRLYHALRTVHRFGRTSQFDMLCLLRDAGILRVAPGSCYLEGATGPLTGAQKLWGQRSTVELDRLAVEFGRDLKVPMDILESALCTWQKKDGTLSPAPCGTRLHRSSGGWILNICGAISRAPRLGRQRTSSRRSSRC